MKRIKRLARKALYRALGVSAWHAATCDRHPYRSAIINHLTRCGVASVLEFGTGFGDIICRLRVPILWATDRSPAVLRGARLCHPWASLSGRVRFMRL